MGRDFTFDSVIAAVDGVLELPPDASDAAPLWQKLDPMLELLLDVTKSDSERHRRLAGVVSSVRAAASELARSLANAKRGGPMRLDWMRFAERDLVKLKDELLALREFVMEEADFLRLACARAQLRGLGRINPEKLFEELHEAGVISERTWAMLMTYSGSWRAVLKSDEVRKQLAQISSWLLDLYETRMGESVNVPKEGKGGRAR